MKKNNYTAEDKLKIIAESLLHGITITCLKYNIATASYYGWINSIKNRLTVKSYDSVILNLKKHIKKLEKENTMYKSAFNECRTYITRNMSESFINNNTNIKNLIKKYEKL